MDGTGLNRFGWFHMKQQVAMFCFGCWAEDVLLSVAASQGQDQRSGGLQSMSHHALGQSGAASVSGASSLEDVVKVDFERR